MRFAVRKAGGWILLVMAAAFGLAGLRAQERPAYTFDELACRSWCELEEIYRRLEPGPAPEGFYRGRVVFRPDDLLAGPRSKIVNFSWMGKHFSDGSLVNQFRGVKMIRADVALGDSWLDGRPAHILDYRRTSLLWNDVRDETREASPGVYLGAMYLRRHSGPKLKVLFVLGAECLP